MMEASAIKEIKSALRAASNMLTLLYKENYRLLKGQEKSKKFQEQPKQGVYKMPVGKWSLWREYTTSDSDMQMIRSYHFKKWRDDKRFSMNQLGALSALGKTLNKNLSLIQRNQILGIFDDVRKTTPR